MKKIRVHELAKELGLTNKEALDLCVALGIGVKSHSSSIEDPQADRVRRKAEREGLIRAEQPPDEEKPKRGVKKVAESTSDVPAVEVAVAVAPPIEATRPEVPTPAVAPIEPSTPVTVPSEAAISVAASIGAAASAAAPPAASLPAEVAPILPTTPATPEGRLGVVATPDEIGPLVVAVTGSQEAGAAVVETPKASPVAAPVVGAPPLGAPLLKAEVVPSPGLPPAHRQEGGRIISSRPAPPRPPAPPMAAPPVARQGTAAPSEAVVPGPRPPMGPPPPRTGPLLSPTGRPIPPPPGGSPRSLSGRPIPPPPGPGRTFGAPGARPGAPGQRPGGGAGGRGPGTGPGRPAGPGGPGAGAANRPGYTPTRPGGGNFPRQSVPGAGVPRGGPGAGGPGGPAGGRSGGPGGGNARRQPQRTSRKKRRRQFEELEPTAVTNYNRSNAPIPDHEVIVERGSSAQELGPKFNRSAADVVRFLFGQGEMVTATQALTDEMIELFVLDIRGQLLLVDAGQEQEAELAQLFADDDEDDEFQVTRPPIITIMGHVDHGKTLLLDRIRSTNVVAGEAGGITQHIGAYQVEKSGRAITFIDTPGHEAFTAMRARGADATDIVVLVVAANDGVMPQTIEALNHAKAADVPIVVAINKIDIVDSDPNRVMQQLTEYELVPEEWGGDVAMIQMSALQNLGIDDLLEQLLLVADVEELTANPDGPARGTVLEANLDVGRGPVATVLVERGTLRIGDPMVAGPAWGTVRALIDDRGNQLKEAGPSTPVQVLGLSIVPGAGDELRVAPNLKTAKTVGEAREQRQRFANMAGSASAVHGGVKLEDIFEQIQKGEQATINLILKADVQGSLEALTESIKKLERPEVKVAFVHRAVGGVTENDVQLAITTGSSIIGFNVRPNREARALAEGNKVEIRAYEIIYKVLEDLQAAMVGMLKPEYEEVVTGEAEVRDVFQVPKVGAIAGCYVRNGTITRNSKVRFLRDGVVIWKGAIASLRRFKDDVRDVNTGFECGVGLTDYKDLKSGDIIETFEEREIARV